MKPNMIRRAKELRVAGRMRLGGGRARAGWRVALMWVWGWVGVSGQENYVHTGYENYWLRNGPVGVMSNYFSGGLSNASTAVYGGHGLGNTNGGLPVGGGYGLEWSSYGQPVQGVQSDVALGEVIVAPVGADTNRPPANFEAVGVWDKTNAYYQCTDPLGGAFWVPSSGQVIAAQPNNITIDWVMTSGETYRQVLNVNAVPPKRPARLFWTEEPYEAPAVDLSGRFPVIHYNTLVPPPSYEVITNHSGSDEYYTTNYLSGVWLDESKHLHAKNVSGLFIIEYYTEGSYGEAVQPDGIEIVQVMAPELHLVKADVGSRLLPVDMYWANLDGINGLLPNVREGQGETAYVYSQVGPKENWVFSIKRTWSEPWTLEIYWQHKGRMGVTWPYEVDWYSCDWPAYPQRYVVGEAPPGDSALVVVPAGLSAEVMADMEPRLHAKLTTSGRSFYTTEPGTCLVKYSTTDNIWFEVIRTVSHTNEAVFDLEPVAWPIGQELRPGDVEAHALHLDGTNDYVQIGTSFLNQMKEWTLGMWFNADTVGSGGDHVLYSEGDTAGRLLVQVLGANKCVQVQAYNGEVGGSGYVYGSSSNLVVSSNRWHYLAVTYAGSGETNGTLAIILDGQRWETNPFPRVNFSGEGQAMMGALVGSAPGSYFDGKLNLVRMWNVVLSDEQLRTNRYVVWPETRENLVANFPVYEGQGDVIHNLASEYGGTICGEALWCYGQYIPTNFWAEYPGYIHEAAGTRYNVGRYGYPTEAAPGQDSHVFGVNVGLLEVWWANRSLQSGMPAVYYPSRVMRYTNVWAVDAPQMVIASGLGSSTNSTVAYHALSLQGNANSYARVPYDEALNVGPELTVEAWVKLSNPQGNNKVVSWMNKVGSYYAGFVLGVYQGAVDVEYWTGSGWAWSLYNHGVVETNTWTHIGYTFKEGLEEGELNRCVVYVNGQAVWENEYGPGYGPIRATTSDLYIGRASWSSSFNTAGEIGEVRVWKVARTAAEMEAGWRGEVKGNEAGLVVSYPFIRGTNGQELTDVGPNRLHGVITNGTWTSPGRPVAVPGPMGSVAVPVMLGAPSIYYQNDPEGAGYNPNEEHALVLDGVAYALRNDLNQAETSEPYVLVDYVDVESGRPKMLVMRVVAADALYHFERDLAAGLPIQPIMPLGAMPLCGRTHSESDPPLPPAWRDRKKGWWAVSGGDDGGTAEAVMYFYYQMQPGFWFPDLGVDGQPVVGTELPWLPTTYEDGGTNGTPVPFVYHIYWPEGVPELKLGQTLTVATKGLPEIWNQLSVEVRYDQSVQQGSGECVTLFDPVVAHGTNLAYAVIDALIQSQLARQDVSGPLIRFPTLPPSLYPRLYYDRNRGDGGQLVLEGQRVETLTGAGYLLLNLLEGFERSAVRDLASGLDQALKGQWDNAVNGLPGEATVILTNTPYVKAALGARLTNGVGYVTLAFNNSSNVQQVPPGLPVSLKVIKVVPELYSGELEVIFPDDALAEQLSLRYSADLAGHVEDAEFEWRWVSPAGGVVPNTNFGGWTVYGKNPGTGSNEVSLSGASLFTMSDHYFAVRYRPTDPSGPSGTNWSDWAYELAPGWVKRAMTGINPFEQIFHDMAANVVDTRVTMISQAGGPYEGDVALNLSAASSAGLIATYQTIFNRAKAFSLDAGMSDANMNQTLLFAASRLHDLYMLLGNEAYADALDPTIAFPRSLAVDEHGADATSIFAFMNQEPNLLEEGLALLRGRDDRLEPSVHTSPIYNRLIWNYTQGINGGEAAYAYNYNIRGDPTNTVGTITAEDAKRFYPQGHGDAWGHYLSAISFYYELLGNPLFGWQSAAEATLLGNAVVSVDYVDEQKFAETAAARARTGAEIVKQTFRQCYSEEPSGRWAGYSDSDTNRAWGVGDWASRAGQAAYYDWAVANSLMVDTLTNLFQVGLSTNAVSGGIQKIDRDSTPELGEIAKTFQEIQSEVDSANAGLNPLGLARNVVPFDIDPAGIDAGQTHFEQVYDRAVQALRNACLAFDHARGATLQLRQQSDSTYDLAESLAASETDYHNRLIAIYGYPYADDIGPGKTYPQGYDGPDLINWQIVDLEDFMGTAPTGQVMEVHVYNLGFTVDNDFSGKKYTDYTNLVNEYSRASNEVGTVSVSMAENGLKVKKSGWTGRRRAQGELQLAMEDYVQVWYALQAKKAEYEKALEQLEVDLNRQVAQYSRYPQEWETNYNVLEQRKATARILEGLKAAKSGVDLLARSILDIGLTIAGAIPSVNTGVSGPFPIAEIKSEGAKTGARIASVITANANFAVVRGMEVGIDARTMQQSVWDADAAEFLNDNNYKGLLKWNTMDTVVKLQDQYVRQAELLAKVQALAQSYERIQKLLASGEQLIFQRGQVRARAAQRLQTQRYADISFRIFRDDALRRYQAAFDLAARYTYLAAKAYDYETGLLYSDSSRTSGSRFLEEVVRACAPGRFYIWLGTPMVGGSSGEPGLADVLARMKADWDVVKGRFGFNNPETETSRFSLRTELFRTSPGTNGNNAWMLALDGCKVANLHELPEFIRYCRPYTDTTNVEPGLVIPFSTCVMAGWNYFGKGLAGGDNAYNPSRAATKVRSMGVWFTGYTNTFNTNSTGPGLANQPYVYLIPIGEDVMRTPTRNALAVRHWQVLDQAIPLPYDVGGADVDNPEWIPVVSSLREPLAQIRRFASFRAYHDSGGFDPAEACTNGRLVGRSVWNTRWLLIIPGRTLLGDPVEGIERFIHGSPEGTGVQDIKIFFQTYSIPGD